MSSTLLIAAIILCTVFFFIIVFISLHRKGNNKKIARQKAAFADCVWKNKLEISEKETINDYLLALDEANFVLLYMNLSQEKEEAALIDLWKINTVNVTTEDTYVYEQRKGKPVQVDKLVSKLQIQVTLVDSQIKANLVLYEYKDGMKDFSFIRKRADYWCQIINKAVQELPHPSKLIVTKV
ncbi:hypothetical protein [Segetibacter koreensis]|uniref:hypothetical protein n=1 Tax=Segetibacter koreensis TaxID=398037 RepID=UPI00035C4D56|nr:hypothetical protein [Segetibacter koreensis]